MPLLAGYGYQYEEALALPTWLFWLYCEGFERERVRERANIYSANVAADSNIPGHGRSQMVQGWEKLLSLPVGGGDEAEDRGLDWSNMSFEEKRKRWQL